MKLFKHIFTLVLVLFFSVTYLHAQEAPTANNGNHAESGKSVREPNSFKPGNDSPDSLITGASYAFSAQSGIALEDMSSGTN